MKESALFSGHERQYQDLTQGGGRVICEHWLVASLWLSILGTVAGLGIAQESGNSDISSQLRVVLRPVNCRNFDGRISPTIASTCRTSIGLRAIRQRGRERTANSAGTGDHRASEAGGQPRSGPGGL